MPRAKWFSCSSPNLVWGVHVNQSKIAEDWRATLAFEEDVPGVHVAMYVLRLAFVHPAKRGCQGLCNDQYAVNVALIGLGVDHVLRLVDPCHWSAGVKGHDIPRLETFGWVEILVDHRDNVRTSSARQAFEREDLAFETSDLFFLCGSLAGLFPSSQNFRDVRGSSRIPVFVYAVDHRLTTGPEGGSVYCPRMEIRGRVCRHLG